MPLIHSECRQTEEYSCTVHCTHRIILCRIKYVVSPTIARDQKKDQEHVYKGYPLASYSPIILVTRCATKSRCFTLADNCSHEAAAPGHCASAVQLPGHYVCGECCQRADREFPGCWSFKH